MTNDLKPIPCGCGGEAKVQRVRTLKSYVLVVMCTKCEIATNYYTNEAEAIQAWNRAMGSTEKSSVVERTAKVIEHDASVTDTDGYKYHRSEYLCGACKKKVIGGDEYCSHCGCRLDWNEDIPMEYFESGGR